MVAPLLERLRAALAERYEVERELGAGGMATVYLARDRRHDRAVALKLLRPELASLLGSERFLAEIRLTAQLSHPHILPLLDSGEADGLLYYAMPLVEGESLRDRLTRDKQLPLDDALALTRQLAGALDYAHAKGIIHRDLKPENVLLSHGQAVLADFGIALAVQAAGGPRLTGAGVAIGTPQYMSPEQATGDRELTAQSDVYSLGAVLYEMLVGDPPHTGSTAQAVIARVMTERPRPIRTVREVPRPVEAAVLKALARSPADRFASAGALATAISQPERAGPRRFGHLVVGLAAVAVVALAVWLGLQRFGSAKPANGARAKLVLGSATVTGADSSYGEFLSSGILNSLKQSPRIELIGTAEVAAALSAMGRQPQARLDQATALEVAFRSGAGGVVLPSVERAGAGFLLTVKVLTQKGELQETSQAQALDSAKLIPAMNELTLDLRKKLGEGAASLQESRSLLASSTTSSEALRLNVRAAEIGDAGDQFGAIVLNQRAVALDSNFTNAWLELAGFSANVGLDYLTPWEGAIRGADRLPLGPRLQMQAEATLTLERDLSRARELVEAANQIPSALAPPDYGTLGLIQLEQGDTKAALATHEIFVKNPGPFPIVAWFNRGLAAGQSGDSLAIEGALADTRSSGVSWLPALARAYASVAAHWWSAASAALQEAGSGEADSPLRLRLWTLLGSVEAVRGRPAASRAAFARAAAVAAQGGYPEWKQAVELQRAEAEFLALGDAHRALESLDALLSPEPQHGLLRRQQAQGYALAAALCARLAEPRVTSLPAPRVCRRNVPTDSSRDALETIEARGWQAVAARRPVDAIALGRDPRLSRSGMTGARARAAAAFVFERQGQPDSAAAIYRAMLPAYFGMIGNAPSVIVMRSYALRRLVALGGAEGERARKELERDWADAEPEFKAALIAPLFAGRH